MMPAPFDGIRERLLQAGFSPSRVRRYLGELVDHLQDLVEAELSVGKPPAEAYEAALHRLGTAEDLVQAMLSRPHTRSWTARAPWLVLPAGALLALAAGYVLSILIMVGAVRSFSEMIDGHLMPPHWLPGPAEAFFALDRFGLPVLIGWGIAVTAIRQRLPPTWPAAAMIVVALVGAGPVLSADWPTTPRPWDLNVAVPLLDPSATMSWAEYPRAVLVSLLLMALPPGIALKWRRPAMPG